MTWRSAIGRQFPGIAGGDPGRSHRAGVHRALFTAALFWSAVVPSIQFLLVEANSRDDLGQSTVIGLVFGGHAVAWVLTLFKRLSPLVLPVTWALFGVAVAAQAGDAATQQLRATLTVAISVSFLVGLLMTLRAAVLSSLAISLVIAATLAVAVPELTPTIWSYLVLLPVNSVASAGAAGIAVRELYSVAGVADRRAHARMTADRTLARKLLEAEAGRRRARLLHDTVVNTLGAIATGWIVSEDAVIAKRCADDVRAVDELRTRHSEAWSSIDDLFVHANTMGVTIDVTDLAGLRRALGEQPAWQRRGILSMIREAVTNVAKHAGVTAAHVAFQPDTRSIAVVDTGRGMSDVGPVQTAMATRAEDAGVRATVISAPGRGTITTIEVPRPHPVPRAGVFERASLRMATGLSAVMLAQFAVVIAVTTTLRTGWSVAALAPALILWLVVATALIVMIRGGGAAPGLPAGAIGATYLALAAGIAIHHVFPAAHSACGVPPNLGWAGDAAAVVCAVLVLLDGRVRVVAPALALAIIAFGSFAVLTRDTTRCGGSTSAMLVADALAVGAFMIVRQQVRRLSDAAATQIDDELRQREEQDHLAAESAIRSAGFDRLLDDARTLLSHVCRHPGSIREPDIRTRAALEESYLRALIGLPYESGDITDTFVRIIDAAKRARVRIEIGVQAGAVDVAAAEQVSAFAVGVIAVCRPDDVVSLGVFRSTGRGELILVAPPRALAAVPADVTALLRNLGPDVILTPSDGLVEVRW